MRKLETLVGDICRELKLRLESARHKQTLEGQKCDSVIVHLQSVFSLFIQ